MQNLEPMNCQLPKLASGAQRTRSRKVMKNQSCLCHTGDDREWRDRTSSGEVEADKLAGPAQHILQKIGEHAQAGRWIKFTSPKEISALQPTLRSYIYEAIQVEESRKKVPLKKASEYVVPEELQVRLNAAPELKAAFEALTPGRRKSYIFHVSGAKQAKTRAARAEKCVPMILSGRGFNERRKLVALPPDRLK